MARTPIRGIETTRKVPFSAYVDKAVGGHRVREAVRGRAPRASDESGQILAIVGLAMGMLIVCVGLVIDVGHAMLVQRQLQAGADAAALAGVQHLPDKIAAETVAMQYSATPGSKNAVNTVGNAATTAKAMCIAGVPGCSKRDGGVNGVVVNSSSRVPTWFGRIIGINELKVSAKSTACAPCTVKPLDIVLVLDRTGSMCQFAPGQNDPNCTDLGNAKSGIRTFLQLLDPTLDKVGLALTPPVVAPSMLGRCRTPNPPHGYKPWNGTSNPNPPPASMDGKYYGYDSYWPDVVGLGGALPGWDAEGRVWAVDPRGSTPSRYLVASLEGADGILNDDYIIEDPFDGSWDINPASTLVQRLGCTGGAGSTSYSLSIEEAQHELERNGRGGVQNVIIFLSDGAANTSPVTLPTGHWTNNAAHRDRPCGTGVEAAAWSKGRGTIIYTIGYDLDAAGGAPERCLKAASNGHQGSQPEQCGAWGCTAYDAIQAMASKDALGNPLFYNKPVPGELDTIFRAIALDLAGSKSRLIDNTSPNLTS